MTTLRSILNQLFDPKTTIETLNKYRKDIVHFLVYFIDEQKKLTFNLDKHQEICASLSLILKEAPYSLPYILGYFNTSHSIFERVYRSRRLKKITMIHVEQLAFLVINLLKSDRLQFIQQWNWSPLFKLLSFQNNNSKKLLLEAIFELVNIGEPTRIQIYKSLLNVEQKDLLYLDDEPNRNSNSNNNFMNKNNLLQFNEDDFPESITKKLINLEGVILSKKELGEEGEEEAEDEEKEQEKLPKQRTEKHNQKKENETETEKEKKKKQYLVFTNQIKNSLSQLALSLSQRSSILIEGPTGVGKTTLICGLAKLIGRKILRISIADRTDCKDLLGAYVCTEVPGEFQWRPGPLTRAVKLGYWVLFEDIDLASPEVLSVLVPVLESRKLFLPGRGEVILAHPDFHLFGEITLIEGDQYNSLHRNHSISMGSNFFLGGIWNRIILNPLNDKELREIINNKYPLLSELINPILKTYYEMKSVLKRESLSLRDLLKFCLRVNKLIKSNSETSKNKKQKRTTKKNQNKKEQQQQEAKQKKNLAKLNLENRENIVVSGILCFCSRIRRNNPQNIKLYLEASKTLSDIWQISEEQLEYLLKLRKPILKIKKDYLEIGKEIFFRDAKQKFLYQNSSQIFSHTGHSLKLMEQIISCFSNSEPPLLVGETGTGKTSIIQYLANLTYNKLVVQNMSQQTDSSDLLGGFKPVDIRLLCTPLKQTFEKLFIKTFSEKSNQSFLSYFSKQFAKKNWQTVMKCFNLTIKNVHKNNKLEPKLRKKWKKFENQVDKFSIQNEMVKNNFAFTYVPGALITALREGHWLLLDELNLATTSTLETLASVLDSDRQIIDFGEPGLKPIKRHPNFKLFACMNPPTDIGKKDLPKNLRSYFTEIYVEDINNRDDLSIIISGYLNNLIPNPPINNIVSFYLNVIKLSEERKLITSGRQKVHYSLRTLTRSLEFVRIALPIYGFNRSLFEGICMTFLTQLTSNSIKLIEKEIIKWLLKNINTNKFLIPPPRPNSNEDENGNENNRNRNKNRNNNNINRNKNKSNNRDNNKKSLQKTYQLFEYFWIETGNEKVIKNDKYIITPSISAHLKNLARVVLTKKYPILLQGPTSSGKTSMIEYLAQITGHKFVRINNHEHTDISEYLGSHVSDEQGKFIFRDGILVEAVKNGWWIVLDELNLAPTEVLEALNRLLDDNRELFIPETQEIIKPHPHFMLFATQNPPGIYGGRKILSRAFRNRFLELHIDDIPEKELNTILEKRCKIPKSFSTKLVMIMSELRRKRLSSRVFAGKHVFITPRDLFKWADRKPGTYKELAEIGYIILAERLRKNKEKEIVKSTIEKILKVKIDINQMYNCLDNKEFSNLESIVKSCKNSELNKIVWTKSMKRLFVIINNCLKFSEPVLLVGETGSGKTTICQLFSLLLKQRLRILNCHMHTETADFIGGMRPIRSKDVTIKELKKNFKDFFHNLENEIDNEINKLTNIVIEIDNEINDENEEGDNEKEQVEEEDKIESENKQEEEEEEEQQQKENNKEEENKIKKEEILKNIEQLKKDSKIINKLVIESNLKILINNHQKIIKQNKNKNNVFNIFIKNNIQTINVINKQINEYKALFTWYDGPLVKAMKEGDLFLIDEISLAEDSVLERLNSILDPNRTILLAEKITETEEVTANEAFRILATQNPGGDFGKRELSPALRNRFTEIYVPTVVDKEDLIQIISERFENKELLKYSDLILKFFDWFEKTLSFLKITISLREILSWVKFMNHFKKSTKINSDLCFLHAGSMVIIDSIPKKEVQMKCYSFLIKECLNNKIQIDEFIKLDLQIENKDNHFGIQPFMIKKGDFLEKELNFNLNNKFILETPTTLKNILRILRALQLPKKPILLEGDPGVGKTSIIMALAKETNHPFIRINLSEQTDMMDLIGTDLPVENGESGEMQWRDGLFLHAIKQGYWVILDELNLASQSVLEGLNAVLDHRSEIYIPELDKTFYCTKQFRIFGCQNPLNQGSGRKEYKLGRKGGPWEFNLRDILRLCQLIKSQHTLFSQKFNNNNDDDVEINQENEKNENENESDEIIDPKLFIPMIYNQRFRTENDQLIINKLFNNIFHKNLNPNKNNYYQITPNYIQFGNSILKRNTTCGTNIDFNFPLIILRKYLTYLESISQGINQNWPILLAGSTGTSKTSLIRLLAKLTGNNLIEFSMNHSVDTMELLGGFEQIDLNRHKQKILISLKVIIEKITKILLLRSTDFSVLIRIFNNWYLLISIINLKNSTKFSQQEYNFLIQLINLLDSVKKLPNNNAINQKLQRILKKIKWIQSIDSKGKFEWVNGLLIEALENGSWFVIENVNFCNPTVLDRLNPLMERGGSLIMTERGMKNGEIEIIKPHPNFRMFYTMNPQNGEISRAMRNRCLELFIPDNLIDDNDLFSIIQSNKNNRLKIHEIENIIQFHQSLLKFNSLEKSNIWNLIKLSSLINEKKSRDIKLSENFEEEIFHSYSLKLKKLNEQNEIIDLINNNNNGKNLEGDQIKENEKVTGENNDGESKTDLIDSILNNIKPPLVTLYDWWKDSSNSTFNVQSNLFKSLMNNKLNIENINLMKKFASFYILETITPNNINKRLDWFKKNKLKSLKEILKTIINNSLMEKILNIRSNTFQIDNDNELINLRINKPLWKLIKKRNQNKEINDMYIKSFQLLEQLINFLNLSFTEKQYLKDNQNKKLNWNKKSCLLKSNDYYQKKIDAEILSHPVLTIIIPFSKLFDNFFLQNYDYNLDKIDELETLLIERNQLFLHLKKNNNFNSQEFLSNWKSFLKALNNFIGFDNINKKLKDTITKISNFFNFNLDNQKFQYYYKFGGKPQLIRFKKIKIIISNILNSIGKIKSFNDYQMVLQSLSTLNWLNYYGIEKPENQSLLDTMELIPGKIGTTDNNNNTSGINYEELIKKNENVNNILKQDSKLINYWCLLEEFISITNLKETQIEKIIEKNYLLFKKKKTKLKKLVPHQNLIWEISNNFNNENSKNIITEYFYSINSHLWNDSKKGILKLFNDYSTNYWMKQLRNYTNSTIENILIKNKKLKTLYNTFIQNEFQNFDNIKQYNFENLKFIINNVINLYKKSFDPDNFILLQNFINNGTNKNNNNDNDNEELNEINKIFLSSTNPIWNHYYQNILNNKFPIVWNQLLNSNNNFDNLLIGRCWFLIGLFKFNLSLPLNPLDPTMKYLIKSKKLKKLIKEIEIEIKIREKTEDLIYGNNTNYKIKNLEQKLVKLKKDLMKIKNQVIKRNNSKFPELYRELYQFSNTIFENKKILNIYQKILNNNNNNNNNKQTDEELVKEEELIQYCINNFINNIKKDFKEFKDIVIPIFNSLYEFKNGLKLMINNKLKKNVTDLESKLIEYLMKYPNWFSNFDNLQEILNFTKQYPKLIFVLIKLLSMEYLNIKEFKNDYLLKRKTKILQILKTFFEFFCQNWSNYEIQKKDYEFEKDQLYKINTFETDNEEEIIEKHLIELFGEHPKDFDDIVETVIDENEDEKKKDNDKDNNNKFNKKHYYNNDEILIFYKIFNELFEKNTNNNININIINNTNNKNKKKKKKKNKHNDDQKDAENYTQEKIIDYFSNSWKVFNKIYQGKLNFNANLNEITYIGNLIMTKLIINKPEIMEECEFYNFYKNSNLLESKLIIKPLKTLLIKIEKIRIEWPENDILMQMETIIHRIFNFNINSPLMKFLNGLEIILQKSQTWEDYAHKAISLKNELNPLYQLVRRWRKYERQNWEKILVSKKKEFEIEAIKLWFDLYSLTQKLTFKSDNNNNNNNNNEEEYDEEDEDKNEKDELISGIEFMIQSSNLGQYKTRLNIISLCGNEQNKGTIKNIFRNIINYYGQYTEKIDNYLQSITQPIEKELKDTNVIEKWRDDNYYRMKETIYKSHVKLNKMSMNYSDILKTPLFEILKKFNEQSIALNKFESNDLWVNEYNKELKIKTIEDNNGNDNDNMSKEYENISNEFKNNNQIKNIFNIKKFNKKIFKHIETINNLIKNVIDSNKLLTLSDTIIKESINLRDNIKSKSSKIRALSDLFKLLEKLKLCTNPGAYLKKNITEKLFLHKPLTKYFDNKLNQYYYKCLSKLLVTREKEKTHNPDITNPQVLKSRGFLEHLFHLIHTQRTNLNKSSKNLKILTNIEDQLTDIINNIQLDNNNKNINNNNENNNNNNQQNDGFNYIFKKQIKIFLQINQLKNQIKFISSSIPEIKTIYDFNKKLEKFSEKNNEHILKNFNFNSNIIITDKELNIKKNNFNLIKEIKEICLQNENLILQPSLNHLINDIDKILNYNDNGTILEKENNEKEQIETETGIEIEIEDKNKDKLNDFKEEKGKFVNEFLLSSNHFFKILLKFIEKVMNLIKPYQKIDFEKMIPVTNLNHLFLNILKASNNSIFLLNKDFQLIMNNYSKFLKKYSNNSEAKLIISYCNSMLNKLLPFINYFKQLFNWIISQSIIINRTFCKLEYVLCNVFTSLYTQGYCQEPEGDDEMGSDEEGNTEFAGGTGMGEGEGIRDVTDKIEHEEQLMDKKEELEEKEEQEEENQQQKNEESDGFDMSYDFDGEVTDLPEKNPEDENSDEEDEEDEEEDNLDEQMGDLDIDNPIDEKLWGSSDEENDNQEEEEEMDNSNKLNQQGDESEFVGKSSDDSDMDNNNDNNDDDDENNNNANEERKKNKDQNIDESNSDDNNEEEPINDFISKEDIQENYSDNEEEMENQEFEIPEDLKLDNGEDQENSEEENSEENQEEEEDLLEMENNEEDENEKEDQDEEGIEINEENDLKQSQLDENENDKMDEEENDDENDDDENNNNNNEGEEIDNDLDEVDEEEQQIDPTVPDIDQKENETEIEDQEDKVTKEEQPYMVKDGKGEFFEGKEDEMEKIENDDEKEENKDDEDELNVAGMEQKTETLDGIGEQTLVQNNMDEQMNNQNEEEEQEKEQKRRKDPNPYRSLGDALKHWEKELDVKDTKKKEDEEKETEEGDEKDTEEVDKNQGEKIENQEFEFIKDDEQEDTQIMTEATNEQQIEHEHQNPENEEELIEPEEKEKLDENGGEDEDEDEDEKNEKKDEDQEKENDNEDLDSKKQSQRFWYGKSKKFDLNKLKEDEDDEQELMDEEEMDDDEQNEKGSIKEEDMLNITATEELEIEDNYRNFNGEQDLELFRENLYNQIQDIVQDQNLIDKGQELWRKYELLTRHLSQELTQQLRLILEPTQATRLKGDYRTGKRINMKKVIPYIASQFKKDKIWMRRTKPSKRKYQILFAIDNSESMQENHAGHLACEALCLIANSMFHLEVGEISVVSFGEQVELLHPFEKPFTDQAAYPVVSKLTFDHKKTDMLGMMDFVVNLLKISRSNLSSNSLVDVAQLVFIISDGRFSDREEIKRLTYEATINQQLIVFLIVDNAKRSLVDMQKVSYPNGKLTVTNYMDDFPFNYYILMREINSIPEVLADALRQWIEMIGSSFDK
ncbi:midasin-related [Anaeramoeba flamelloides]|uniref:Midasin n=1 Tax=Anaeramoeba flamelloides TaxID=1746091 RepID=A0ABQ8Y7X2_9EUKA|nr:midasin-related [Anaeramoeba flamelloides]